MVIGSLQILRKEIHSQSLLQTAAAGGLSIMRWFGRRQKVREDVLLVAMVTEANEGSAKQLIKLLKRTTNKWLPLLRW